MALLTHQTSLMTRITTMKILSKILLFILPALIMSSCVAEPDDISGLGSGMGNYGSSENPPIEFYPLGNSDYVPVYATVNDKDNISVIGSGNAFEVTGLMENELREYLGNYEVMNYSTNNSTLNTTRDLIPYVHEDYTADNIAKRDMLMTVVAHDMTFDAKYGGKIHNISIHFEPSGNGRIKYARIASQNYWMYAFAMISSGMTIDGDSVESFKDEEYVLRIFYTPSGYAKKNVR